MMPGTLSLRAQRFLYLSNNCLNALPQTVERLGELVYL